MDDADSATSKICRGTCSVLEYLINRNASAPRVKSHFHSNSAPPIPIVAYVQRIVKHAYCSDEAFIGALMFLAYHCAVTNHPITTYNVHRIYFTAVVIAIKCRDDHYRSNVYYAQVGGLTRQKSEVGTLETEFLSTIGWDSWMDEQIYMQTYNMVEQLSDLPATLSEDDNEEIAQAVDYWESKLFSSFHERRDALNRRLREDMIAVAAAQKRSKSLHGGSPTSPNSPMANRGAAGGGNTSLAAVAGAPSFYPQQRAGSAASNIPSGAPHSVTGGGSLLKRPNSHYTAEEQQQFGTIGQMSGDSALYSKFAVGDIIRVEKEAPVHQQQGNYGGGGRAGSIGGTGVAEDEDDQDQDQKRQSGGGGGSGAISCGMYIPRRGGGGINSNNNTASFGSDTTSATGSPIKVLSSSSNGGGGGATASSVSAAPPPRGASSATNAYSGSNNGSPLSAQDRGLSTELYIPRKAKKKVQGGGVSAEGPNTPNDNSNSRDPSFNSTPTSATTGSSAFPSQHMPMGNSGNAATNKLGIREGSEMGRTSSFQGSPTDNTSNRQFPSVSRSTVAVNDVDAASKRSSIQQQQQASGTPLTYQGGDSSNAMPTTSTSRRGNNNNITQPTHTRSFSPDVVPQGLPTSTNTSTTGFSRNSLLSPSKGNNNNNTATNNNSIDSPSASFASGFNTTAPKHSRAARMPTKHRFSSASLNATPDGDNSSVGDRYAVTGATNQRFASYHEYPASHHVDPSSGSAGNAPGVRLTSVPQQTSSFDDANNNSGAFAHRTAATKSMPERFLQVATGSASAHNLNTLRKQHQSGSKGYEEGDDDVACVNGRGGSLDRGEEEEGEADRFASTSPNTTDGWRTTSTTGGGSRNTNYQQQAPNNGLHALGGGGGAPQRGNTIRSQHLEGKKRAKNPAWVQED